MRKEAAFNFIPELIGDFSHVMELSGNPKALYVEAAVGTLHTAVNVFAAFQEYGNTKRKKATKRAIQQKYEDLKSAATLNYQTEELRRLDIEYEKVKNKIHDGKFRDREVRGFIKYLQTDLQKVYEIFQHTQVDPDYPERTRVEEVARKTLRDYKKLITIYIEEEEKDGQD